MERPIFLGPPSLMCKCPHWAFCYPANPAASSIDALYAGGTVICCMAFECVLACARGEHALAVHRPARGVEGMSITIADVEAARRTIAGQVLRTPMLPAPKLSALTGAEVFVQGETVAEAQIRAEILARERGLTFVHPYDDPLVIAGQGTIALEMLEDAPDLDVLVIPIGGGGLIAGNAIAARARMPTI